MSASKADASLKDYVETRFNLLTTDIDSRLGGLRDELTTLVSSNDVRYQQRFDAQGKALDAAFGAAKEAVTAALAAADKAAVKTELTADKRFSDLGDLIREQFKGLSDKFEASSHRLDAVEGRLNTASGEVTGGQHLKTSSQNTLMLVVTASSALIALIALLVLVFHK